VPPNTARNTGVFVFEERPFGDVNLELGARSENQSIELDDPSTLPDYDKTSFNVSAGAVWKFTPQYATSLNVTRSERHPSATELYANGPHVAVGRFVIGDPTLDRETALTADLTLRKYEGPVQFVVTAFTSSYNDFIFEQATGEFAGDEEPFPVFEIMQQDADFYGFESEVILPLGAHEALNGLDLRLASDYVRGKFADGGGNIPLLPPWRFGAELTYHRERLHASLSSYYYAEQDKEAEGELPTDSYTMVDADVSYRLPMRSDSVFLFLRGSNLLDDDARRSTSPLKDFAPLAGRSLEVGARLEF
jgi:iron complex outermembrane receptor protein